MPDSCLSDLQLRDILDDATGDTHRAHLHHLGECTTCRERLDERASQRAAGPGEPATGTSDLTTSQATGPYSSDEQDDTGFPTIPGFSLLRKLGEGGMGVVYEAREVELHRTVALKVIRPGCSASAVPRLRHEANLLGLLGHAGVAQVYRVGTFASPDGTRPFFCMEYVEGKTLTAHIEHHRPDLRQKVELLALICDAVQHAHQKGVIHRDLKPGNVLVTADGRPKVLDFGVGRVVDREAAFGPGDAYDESMHTQAGAMVGTVSYMSPEQVGPDRERDVDTRSDVYALGLIAYRVFTGRHAYDLKKKSLDEVVGIIRRVEPMPLRRVDPSLPADLENIVARSLEKDKERRYPSAQALADDLRRHLDDEPVTARPLGNWERSRRFVRRNRTLVGGVFAVFIALLTGLGTTAWQAQEAWSQKATADLRGITARDAQLDAEQKAKLAEDRKKEVETALDKANKATDKANKATVLAESESRQNLARFIQLTVGRGNEAVRDNDLLAALPYYVQALRRDRDDEAERHRRRIGMLLRQTARLTHAWSHADSATHVAFSPDGRRVVSVGLDGTARLVDAKTGRLVASGPMRHKGPVNHAAFSRDGKWLVTGGDDGKAQVWESEGGKALGKSLAIESPVSHVAFHPTDPGRVLVVGGTRFARTLHLTRPGASIVTPGAMIMVPGPPTMIPGPGGRMIPGPPRMIAMPGTPIIRQGAPIASTQTPEGIAQVFDLATGKVLRTMNTDGWFNHASFSPDGSRVVTAGGSEDGDNEAEVHDLVEEKAKRKRRADGALEHTAPVHRAAFSPDGRRIVTASGNLEGKAGEARLWDADTGKALGRAMRHGGLVSHASFSPDGRRVVTASLDETARVWDALTGDPLALPLRHQERVVGAWFSPDGRRILTASWDGTARVWDASTGELLLPPLRHGVALTSAAFDPEGYRVVTAGRDGSVRIWNLVLASHDHPALRHHGLVPAQDGGRTLTMFRGDADDRQIAWSKSYLGGVVVTGTSPASGGKVLATVGTRILETIPGGGRAEAHHGTENTHVVLWDLDQGRSLARPFPHRLSTAESLLAPDGRRVVTFGSNETHGPAELTVWHTADGKPLRRVKEAGAVQAIAFRADGRCLFAASSRASAPRTGSEVRVREATGEGPAWKDLLLPLPGPLEYAVFGQGAETLATVSIRGGAKGRWQVQLWDMTTGSTVGPAYEAGPITRVVIGPGGKHLLAFAPGLSLVTKVAGVPVPDEARSVVHLLDARTGRGRPLQHPAPITCVAFSEDGRQVATACLDHTARVWDVASGDPISPPLRHGGKIQHVHFAPSGATVLATASDDRTAKLWDTQSGDLLAPPLRHRAAVLSATFLPDGKRLLTCCADGTVRVWDCTRDARKADDLDAVARLLAGQRLDETKGMTTLSPSEIERLGHQTGADPAAVRRWHDDEAAEAELANDWAAAVFHLDRLIHTAEGPKTDLYARRASANARLERWEAAESDHLRLVEARPSSAVPYFALAVLQVWHGRTAEYRRTCSALMEAHGKTTDRETATLLIRTCVLHPDSAVDAAELLRAAENVVGKTSPVRGAALHRAGQFAECAKLLQRASGRDGLFLAMAHHRLGRVEEAKKALEQAIPRLAGPAAAWPDRLEQELLRREAALLLK